MTIKQIDDDDDDILRDGETARVPMFMKDGGRNDMHRAAKVTDAAGGTIGLHRPGFRLNPSVQRDQLARAYALYDKEIAVAYLHNVPNVGLQAVSDPPRSTGPADGRTVDARTAAYEAYDLEISNAWRGSPR